MDHCFEGCSSLSTAPVIPNNVTDMRACFNGCTSLTGTVIINASITDSDKWDNAFYNVSGVTVQVPDYCTKQAIMSASGNSGITTIVVADGSTSCP